MEKAKKEQNKPAKKTVELSAVDQLLTKLWDCYDYEPTLISIHLRVYEDDNGKKHKLVSIVQSIKVGSNVDLLKKLNPLTG